MKILTTAKPGTPEWLRHHKGKIGGSDAASVVLGDDPNVRTLSTPLGVFVKLRAELEGLPVADDARAHEDDDELDDDDAPPAVTEAALLRYGTAMEAGHLQLLEQETFCRFEPSPGLCQDDEFPWLAGTPDACAMPTSSSPDPFDPFHGQPGVTELKAPVFTRGEWRLGLPEIVQVQATVYMRILGHGWALCSGLVPPEARWDVFERATDYEAFVIEKLLDFMENHVMRDIPPPPSGKKGDDAALRALFRGQGGGQHIMSTEGVERSFEAVRLAAQANEIKKRRRMLTQQILGEIGTAKWGVVADGFVWRVQDEPAEPTHIEYVRQPKPVLRKMKGVQ